MKKYLILLIGLIGVQYLVKSQDNPLHIEIVPPSPNAASLGKYGEIPVNYYTGTPNINIPLYDIPAGEFTVPISISYHASGIKVEEMASWVGLGWSLNAGGVITRTMRGLPDERRFSGILEHGYSVDDVITANSNDKLNYFDQITNNQLDFEPDMFYFNFNGRSGRFFLEKENEQIIGYSIPYQDISIVYNSDQTWTIIDEKGFKYTFGEGNAQDITINDRQGTRVSSILTFNSAWYLTKIISPNNDSVMFTYENYTINYCQKSYETSFFLNSNASGSGCSSDRSQKSYSDVSVEGARIKNIVFNQGTVNFIVEDQERLDIMGDSALHAIEIRDLKGDLKKRFELSYEYFTSFGALSNDYCLGNQDSRKYRLKLTGVQEKIDSNNLKPPYSFIYNSKNLPERLSNAQDHWGFYNGKVNNSSLVPKYLYLNPNMGSQITLPGANRMASDGHMQAAIIEQIKYPTGGTTDFEFEPHQALVPATFLWQTEQTVDGDSLYANVRAADAADTRVVFADFTIDAPPELVQPGRVPGLMMEITISGLQGCNFGDRSGPSACGIFIDIFKENGEIAWSAGREIGSTYITNQFLENGNYQLTLEIFDGLNPLANHFVVNVSGPKSIPVFSGSNSHLTKRNITVGGLRIHRITSQDPGSLPTITRFTYKDKSDPEKSSGVVITEPVYGYDYRSAVNCYDFVRTARSNVILGTTQGGHVGYEQVQVYYGENGESGKSSFQYTTANEYPDRIRPTFPFPPAESFDWKRGLLVNQIDLKKSAGDYERIRKVINDYEIKNVNTWNKRKRGLKVGCQISSRGGCTDMVFEEYGVSTGWHYLGKVYDVRYDQNNTTDSIFTERQFFYDRREFHVMPTSETKSTSHGQTVETRFKYPLDYEFAGVAVDSMVKRHILAPVIEESKWVDGELVYGVATEYKIEDKIVVPENVYLIETSGGLTGLNESTDGENFDINYKERANYLYDKNGNLIQIRETNNMPTSYVWGYNNTFPVAQAIGVEVALLESSVADAVNSLATYSNGLDDLEILLADINGLDTENKRNNWRNFNLALNSSLEEGQITTYTYDPLVGITSQTDPNGITTYYEYDALGRLQHIRDHEENIVQHYEYRYHSEAQGGGQ